MTNKDIKTNRHTVKSTTSILKKLQESDCQNTNSDLTILIFKKEQSLEIWSTTDTCKKLIETFPIQLSSILSGPKLYDSEARIPEGIYRFELHQDSILINFPNQFDQNKAIADNRPLMESNIVFQSVMSDNSIILSLETLKELRVLLENVDLEKTKLIIVPNDIRNGGYFSSCMGCPHWIFELYGQLKFTLNTFIE